MAKNKNINILLKLTDKFSDPLKKATQEVKDQQKAITRANNLIVGWGKTAVSNFNKIAKAGAVAAGALGGIALKTGFSEALDLEGYRMQLETATKDTQKASAIMRYAIEMANKTPFEGGEMVEAASKFESMAMDSTKWLSLAGDMAASTNKSLDQSVEALIDAQTGELERLKEFGITKTMIVEQANAMGKAVVDTKGSITDLQGFNEALVALMESKYTGGMEKQATTIRGMWSTVTGVAKNSLAQVVGMTNDGSVKAGSLLAMVKGRLQQLTGTLERWQRDGTIEALADKASAAFTKLGNVVGFVIDHWQTLVKVGGVAVGVFGGMSVISGTTKRVKDFSDSIKILRTGFSAFRELGGFSVLLSPLKTVIGGVAKAVKGLFSLLTVSPIGLVIAGIAIVVAALINLYNKNETFRNAVNRLWTAVKSAFANIKNAASDLKDKFVSAFTTLQTKISSIADKIKEFLQPIADIISAIKSGLSGLGGVSSFTSGTGYVSMHGHALGTPFFAGGATRINEGGRGETVILPSGTQIIPHDVATKQGNGTNVTVNVTVQGNVIGNRDFMEQTGAYISHRIIAALGVV